MALPLATRAGPQPASGAGSSLVQRMLHSLGEEKQQKCTWVEIPDSESSESKCRPLTVVCVSDTHNTHCDVFLPTGDILLHCGDFSNKQDWYPYMDSLHTVYRQHNSHVPDSQLMSFVPQSVLRFNEWLGSLKGKYKDIVSIAGNQELGFNYFTKDQIRRLVLTNCTYLQDDGVTLDCGLRLWGSPWTSSSNMAFSYSHSKLNEKWSLIPSFPHVDLLLTHLPPYLRFDLAIHHSAVQECRPCGVIHRGASHWGSDSLDQHVRRRVRPMAHVFGHVHNTGGGWVREEGIVLANCATKETKKAVRFYLRPKGAKDCDNDDKNKKNFCVTSSSDPEADDVTHQIVFHEDSDEQ